ncbi:MAG: hypothetical protein Q4B95_06180 [Lonepinella koalarum]|nr:hypothetical protein [Lonepinella koalarum]
MKLNTLFFSILLALPLTLSANWKALGQANYTWGPFQVYSLSLFSENGHYQENQRPLMLTFKFDKPIEGKNFAISLIKEIDALKITDEKTDDWLTILQKIMPDLSPKDSLSYIALEKEGYFVINDTVLAHHFEPEFNRALLSIWLSPNSNFSKIREQLLNPTQENNVPENNKLEPIPQDSQEINPQIPPEFELKPNPKESFS